MYGEEQESKEVKQHLKNKEQLYYLTNTFWSVAFIKVTMTVMTTGKKKIILKVRLKVVVQKISVSTNRQHNASAFHLHKV